MVCLVPRVLSPTVPLVAHRHVQVVETFHLVGSETERPGFADDGLDDFMWLELSSACGTCWASAGDRMAAANSAAAKRVRADMGSSNRSFTVIRPELPGRPRG